MNKQPYESPLENKISDVMHTVNPRQDFSESLLNDILRQKTRSSGAPWKFRGRRWAAAGVLALVLLASLAVVGPYRVAAALQSLIGYLPGIGFVEDSAGTLYLAQPLTSRQEGVSLIVDQVAADSERTTVAYHFEGLPQTPQGEVVACVYDDNKIRLPDGKQRLPVGGGLSGGQARIEFQPLPAGVKQFTLLVAMNNKDERCQAPEKWSVDIPLGSMPPQVTLMPVYEGAQIVPTLAATAVLPAVSATPQNPAGDIQFIIDRVAELDEGYLISGHSVWKNPDWERVDVFPDQVSVLDADGNQVPFEAADVVNQDSAFSYQLSGKNWRSPLTLKVSSVWVQGTPAKTNDFSWDAGLEPKAGQSWQINRKLEALGLSITVQKVSVTQLEDGASGEKTDGFAFDLLIPENMNLVNLVESGSTTPRTSVSESKNAQNGHQILEVGYPDGLPTGRLTYKIAYMIYNLKGEWQTTWSIPQMVTP
ncbi:MAG: hypothetical protein LWX83_09090 [Anaerolineae bacterium]|nr:hypothetical protein [Anaerolineae bacterium]